MAAVRVDLLLPTGVPLAKDQSVSPEGIDYEIHTHSNCG
jgi:hypothetical protein